MLLISKTAKTIFKSLDYTKNHNILALFKNDEDISYELANKAYNELITIAQSQNNDIKYGDMTEIRVILEAIINIIENSKYLFITRDLSIPAIDFFNATILITTICACGYTEREEKWSIVNALLLRGTELTMKCECGGEKTKREKVKTADSVLLVEYSNDMDLIHEIEINGYLYQTQSACVYVGNHFVCVEDGFIYDDLNIYKTDKFKDLKTVECVLMERLFAK